ncbi:MAG: alpha/beta hydrolase [Hyphomicrobiales bacterium]|nr:alpha/beta hydrolase [Hyphomicrobiales bacterium]
MDKATPDFITRENAPGERRLAVIAGKGARSPAIIWLGGFRSDMRATKAEALARWAERENRRFVRFDYTAHGESEGDFSTSTISVWLADAMAVIAAHGAHAPLLVGSSMGGWLALLAAKAMRARGQAAGGLVLIAPAVDFTEELMWSRFPADVQAAIMQGGQWLRPSIYAPEPYPITRALIEDGRRHLLFGAPIEPGCPVTILQGMQDPDVPWQHAMKLVEHLPADQVTLTLIKDGDHRLSRDQDIELLITAVTALL